MNIDINKEQRRASNPFSSVWVSASAGSGKTKVLTDRVLNLLLTGCPPEKLLCLTFTKAAATEMSNRVNNVLKKWAICPEEKLVKEISDISGETPSAEIIKRARRLFAEVLETAGGIKIMNTHSFCQTLLKRFPLEASVPPNFDVIDEKKSEMLISEALQEIMENPNFRQDIVCLSPFQSMSDLIKLLNELLKERSRLSKLLGKNSLKQILWEIKRYFKIENYNSQDEIVQESFTPEKWLENKEKYLTNSDLINKKLKKELKNSREAAQTEEVAQKLRNFELVEISSSLLKLAYAILEKYKIKKQAEGLMDFDDLISATKNLLSRSHAAAWVLFKLDGGLNHILVDEAQDTNPDQWFIIKSLAEEFFSGEDHHDTIRTIFAVGDKKQSIYSFQGAEPNEFERMRIFFDKKVQESENDFETVPFNMSFRSTKPVLDLVNRLLNNPIARKGVLSHNEEAIHIAYREHDAGLVEIWPLEKYEKPNDVTPWKPPVERIRSRSASSKLAEKIADKISDMIKNKEILESQGRPVIAGDFMILVQRRNGFVNEMVRLLKERNIPVAGIDRLNLSRHITVQDLMSAAKFVLLPEDNLNLACLLKSPLIQMSENELFQASYNRDKRPLWTCIKEKFPQYAERLNVLLNMADKVLPYDFFAYILGPMQGRKRFLARLGNEAIETLDEFLNLVMDFEKNNIPSLQAFIDSMEQKEVVIKRDMESAQNAVRIMTVHASKGLQGRIVFLPQTRNIVRKRSKILWLNDKLPFWVPNKEMHSQKTTDLLDLSDEADDEENKRLLYVAVTRASDRLYICGYNSKNDPRPDNWYDLIKQSVVGEDTIDKPYQIKSPQSKKINSQKEKENIFSEPLPDWAYHLPPEEPTPSKPLSPSRQEDDIYQGQSPLSDGQSLALKRGVFIHQLLQYLPTLPPEKWDIMIERLNMHNIPVPSNLKTLLTQSEFQILFGKNTLSEVPVVGIYNNITVSGQIDKLVVLDKEVWIVDYKTNRNVPKIASEVPLSYKKQLNAYKGLIKSVFSDKIVRTFLLWTENLNLMEIFDEA